MINITKTNKCLNGHVMDNQDDYICWRCGNHIETDIQRGVIVDKKRKIKKTKNEND